MISFIRNLCQCFMVSARDTVEHDGIEYAGYLSFLILLSLFPFLFFFMVIAGTVAEVTGIELVIGRLFELLWDVVPKEIVEALKPRVIEIISAPPQSLVTFVILSAIWTASSAVEGLKTVVNRAYRVHMPPPYFYRRLVSIGQFLLIVLVIITFIGILTLCPVFFRAFVSDLGIEVFWDWSWSYYEYSILVLGGFILVWWLNVMLPSKKQKWWKVFPGSLLIVIMCSFLTSMLLIYIHHFPQLNLIYGSLAGIVISLLFFYAISISFVFGAEFNYNLQKIFYK